jgi:hypothetical protein
MLVEGRECSLAFRTFKRWVVGGSVYPKYVDKQSCLSYNRYLLDIVEHIGLTETDIEYVGRGRRFDSFILNFSGVFNNIKFGKISC